MVTEKTWDEFRNSKMLWFVNRMLHIMGWAIVLEFDDKCKETIRAYPARVKFRGFSEKDEDEGFIGISKYMNENSEQLLKEANDDEHIFIYS